MKFLTFILSLLMLSACAVLPASSDRDAQNPPGPVTQLPTFASTDDAGLSRVEVNFDAAQILSMESDPLQFTLNLKGNLPTPCHKLHVDVGEPDAQNQIHIDAYSLVDPALACAQVLQPFDVTVPIGSFPAGRYTLWLNGEMIGEIQA